MGNKHHDMGRRKWSQEAEEERTGPTFEKNRSRTGNWDNDYVNSDQYAKSQLKMLRKELWIEPSRDEVARLMRLKGRGAIDSFVQEIIERYEE